MTDPTPYKLILKSSSRKLLTVNAVAIIIGVILLFYWLSQRSNFDLTAFYVMSGIVVLWMVADYLYWLKRGVREIRIMESAFEVYRGKNFSKQVIQGSQITDVYFENRLSRRTFQILLGNKIKTIPGVFTYFPEPKIRITSDYFNDQEFDQACDLIEKMFSEQTNGNN